MTDKEIEALIELEVSLAAYLQVVLGETDDLYAPEDSTTVERLKFIKEQLDSMI